MLLISHRGNLDGPSDDANNPNYVAIALAKYDVEIDVWFQNGQFLLGHDKPQYPINDQFLLQHRLWCHAKNPDALERMSKLDVHCFWHQNDYYTLTSQNYVWTYPGMPILSNGVINASPLEFTQVIESKAFGVCTDYVNDFEKAYEQFRHLPDKM
jgi:hypothetical protein